MRPSASRIGAGDLHPDDPAVFADVAFLHVEDRPLALEIGGELSLVAGPIFRGRQVCRGHPQQLLAGKSGDLAVPVVHPHETPIEAEFSSAHGRGVEKGPEFRFVRP